MNVDPFKQLVFDTEISKGDLSRARQELAQRRKKERTNYRKSSVYNEVPVIQLEDEVYAERKIFESDYVAALQELFPRSTGLKPFCAEQIRSVRASEQVINDGGNVVKCEPRGFGKTTRTSNEALLAILQGKVRYILILASEVTKAEDILDIIKAQLWTNEALYRLYQPTIECFRSLDNKPHKAAYQTYAGEHTHIVMGSDLLVFPCVPGEPSSGCLIRVRSKDNVRGVIYAPKDGPYAGEILRPELVMLDDIQKDVEARNSETVRKMVETINKSVLMSGSHSKPISAIMTATPMELNDVPSTFMYYEPDWFRVKYSMMASMPHNIDVWMTKYADILTSYDKDDPSDIQRARKEALQFYIENRATMDEGAEACWEWAYAWQQKSRCEISATQHAMNILILKGEDLFETECQTNVKHKLAKHDAKYATLEQIRSKVLEYPQLIVPTDTRKIVAHIDVNDEFLSYAIATSGDFMAPHFIDYGTWPDQGFGWTKSKLMKPFSLHPDYNHLPTVELRKTKALHELIKFLNEPYQRADGKKVFIDKIGVDRGDMPDTIYTVCEQYPQCIPVLGEGILAKDKPMSERSKGKGDQYFQYCMLTHAYQRTYQDLRVDTNWHKDYIHRGILTSLHEPESITFFKGDHIEPAKHIHAEKPQETKCEKSGRTRNKYIHASKSVPNEYFDNMVGCVALLSYQGIPWGVPKVEPIPYDFNEIYNNELVI